MTRRRSLTILDIVHDPNLFGPWFAKRDTWDAWFAFLAALFALPMSEEQFAIYRECTGRNELPSAPAREANLVIGRRGGKSFILALIAVFIACFTDHRRYLAPGERATIMVIAKDRKQARNTLRYIRAMLQQVRLLASMIERETADGFDLNNSVTIEVHTASYTSTRGYAVAVALCDEAAYWPTEDSAQPDYEIINALRPGMAQFPYALLIVASSPYARKGVLWDAYRKHYGRDSEVLVWKAPTRRMNPTISQRFIDSEIERDPAVAAAEYGAEFRSDLEAFINREIVEACIANGVYERPPQSNARYVAFTDPSGGAADSFTLGIAHKDDESVIVDAIREIRPPFSPESVVEDYARLLKTYRINKVTGDRYAGEWPREQFRKHGITYQVSDKPKSDLYRDTLPLLTSRRVVLLDNQRLVAQLTGLERRTARSGRDSIDHGPGGHDDVCNAVCGALVAAAAPSQQVFTGVFGYGGPVTQVDIKTGQPIRPPRHNPLAPGAHNECIPGRGLDADASLFNAQRGIINLGRRTV